MKALDILKNLKNEMQNNEGIINWDCSYEYFKKVDKAIKELEDLQNRRGKIMLKPNIPLSPREEAHFKLMLDGVSPKEIAEIFDIQPVTVKKRVARILEKYDMPNTLKLVCAYYKSLLKDKE